MTQALRRKFQASHCVSSWNHKVAFKSTEFPTDLRTPQNGHSMAGYLTIPRGKIAFLVASWVPQCNFKSHRSTLQKNKMGGLIASFI